MGAADFVPKNGIFGINGITVCFCLFYSELMELLCVFAYFIVVVLYLRPHSWTPIQSCTATITKNHRNSINSKNSIPQNKISSAHHDSLRAMEFLESLDLPSLSFTLAIEGDRERPPPSHPYLNDRRRQRERPPPSHPYLNDRRRQRETTTQPPLP